MNPVDISLYAIVDPARSQGRALPELAARAAEGGVTLVQYRDKTATTRQLVTNAQAIKDALAPFDVPLLINDRVDVALAAGAHGVHLGQDDLHPNHARQLLGDKAIIGLTIKNPGHAHAAPLDLIDYACIGGVFDTLSKDNPTSIGLEGWANTAAVFREAAPELPVGAIAGIDATNLAAVIAAGADGAAIISGIFMQDDVTSAASHLRRIIDEVKQ